jgi:hypothetical protein
MGYLTIDLPSPNVALAYPALPASASAGFGGTIAVPDIAPGRHELGVRITTGNGNHLVIEREFEVVARDPSGHEPSTVTRAQP